MTLRIRTRHVRSLLPAAGLCIAAALTPLSALADTDLSAGDSAVVAWANGDHVNLRVGPGPDEAVIAEVPEGSAVYVIDGLYTGTDGSLWYQVEANGEVGYMIADYVASGYGGGASVGGPTGGAVATEQVYVRTGPSTADSILGNLQAGDAVELTGSSSNGFYEIWYGDYVGYVYADYINPGGSAAEVASEPVAEVAAASESQPNGASGTFYTTDSVNLRSGADTGSSVISVLPGGADVWLTGYVANGFSEVSTAWGDGWVSTDYLSENVPAAAAPEPEAPAGNQSIVDFAMQFQGYPYVWAGNTPGGGFDCSGLTQYVVQNTLGIDITHSTDIQATYGSSVAWGAWQPGDLIFFVGTYEGGSITHVGIYIGDGMMIHAENPGTGVVISDITSGYYAEHYYSATRL
ncbi:MAG TPA: SH3 domain-containing protein [Thermomicrobiales bacterium]|nr:SH3 domain-containing protein [Thermomicrobiales bacterium]